MKEAVMASRATLDGKETRIDQQALEQLRMTIRGDVLTPEDPSYAGVRIPFNAMHPGQPALVIRPTGTADVIDAVNFARDKRLLVAVERWGALGSPDSRASMEACSSTSRE